MRLFGRRSKEAIAGDIGYHGLADWWNTAFTAEERAHVERTYKPMGAPADYSLVKGEIGWSSATPTSFLNGLASWFRKPVDRHLELRILDKAEELGTPGSFDLHLTFSSKIENHYRRRDDDPAELEAALTYCRKQIAMAPQAAREWRREYGDKLPSHVGYQQLTIVLEKQGDYRGAIKLAQQARKQGWAGDWEKRIDRCERKLAKGQ